MTLDTSHIDAGWTDPRDALVAEMAQALYEAMGCSGADPMARLLDYAESRVPLADGSLLLGDADLDVLCEELTEADWVVVPELPIRDDKNEVVGPRRSAAERRGHVRRWLSVVATEKTLTSSRTLLSYGHGRRSEVEQDAGRRDRGSHGGVPRMGAEPERSAPLRLQGGGTRRRAHRGAPGCGTGFAERWDLIMRAANDTAHGDSRVGAGRDTWKAISTMEKALASSNYATARKAAIYAFPRLSVSVPVPLSDDATTWALVLRTLKARAETRDAEAMRWRAGFAE